VSAIQTCVTPVLTVACGEIDQPLTNVDIAQGVILAGSVSCTNNADCRVSSATFNVTPLAVTALDVTANDVDLVNQQALTLPLRPLEIALAVTATFSDDSSRDVTINPLIVYTIIQGSGVVIENSNTVGVYTVLAAGTAEIEMVFRGQRFNALIVIP